MWRKENIAPGTCLLHLFLVVEGPTRRDPNVAFFSKPDASLQVFLTNCYNVEITIVVLSSPSSLLQTLAVVLAVVVHKKAAGQEKI